MTDLISFVMEAAATEVLYHEAAQIDQEVQRLLAEMEHATVEERRRGGFAQRFLELLRRRGEIARKALIIFEEPQSEKISVRVELGSAARYYKPTPQPVAAPIQHATPSRCGGRDLKPLNRVQDPLQLLRIILSKLEAEQEAAEGCWRVATVPTLAGSLALRLLSFGLAPVTARWPAASIRLQRGGSR